MRRISFAALIVVATVCGCARPEPTIGTPVDIARAARDAQGMVNAYGENVADGKNDTLPQDVTPGDTGVVER